MKSADEDLWGTAAERERDRARMARIRSETGSAWTVARDERIAIVLAVAGVALWLLGVLPSPSPVGKGN